MRVGGAEAGLTAVLAGVGLQEVARADSGGAWEETNTPDRVAVEEMAVVGWEVSAAEVVGAGAAGRVVRVVAETAEGKVAGSGGGRAGRLVARLGERSPRMTGRYD